MQETLNPALRSNSVVGYRKRSFSLVLHQQIRSSRSVGFSHAFPKVREPHNSQLPTCHKQDSGSAVSIETPNFEFYYQILWNGTVLGWKPEVAQTMDCKEALPVKRVVII
jgi:hypothetical protein